MSNFERYSAYYDLLYRDKDYAAEARHVAERLRATAPEAREVLELGSGTGRHGRLLGDLGFVVHGVERSAEMVAIARASPHPGFTCEVGDIRTAQAGRRFDAVISLFHVISYQTTNEDLRAAFRNAAAHLRPGGIFLFDVWHGPAVLTQRPERRVKEAADGERQVTRTAEPSLDPTRGVVDVVFHMDCLDLRTGERAVFRENHAMRYLFPTEIELLAEGAGFNVESCAEFLTGAPAGPSTWGVAYLLRARR